MMTVSILAAEECKKDECDKDCKTSHALKYSPEPVIGECEGLYGRAIKCCCAHITPDEIKNSINCKDRF